MINSAAAVSDQELDSEGKQGSSDSPLNIPSDHQSPANDAFACDEKMVQDEPRELLLNWSRSRTEKSSVDERREEQEEKAVLQEFAFWLRKLATAAAAQMSTENE